MILIIIENGDYTVYIHTNKMNGKRYIGITRQTVEDRWRGGKGYKHCILLNRAIQKYGWDGFDHDVFASKLTEDEAINMEKLLIKELKTQDPEFGYNIADGGSATKFSDEARKRISENMRGERNPCYRKIYTEEERERISKQTFETGNPNYKRKHTEEERKRMSEANLGRHLSDEHKKKISERFKGKKIQVLYVSKLEKYSIVSLRLQLPKTCIITERILVKFVKEKEISLADTIGNITNHLFHNISNDYRKHKALRLKKRVE